MVAQFIMNASLFCMVEDFNPLVFVSIILNTVSGMQLTWDCGPPACLLLCFVVWTVGFVIFVVLLFFWVCIFLLLIVYQYQFRWQQLCLLFWTTHMPWCFYFCIWFCVTISNAKRSHTIYWLSRWFFFSPWYELNQRGWLVLWAREWWYSNVFKNEGTLYPLLVMIMFGGVWFQILYCLCSFFLFFVLI